MTLLDIARLFKHVREAGQNLGQRVEGIIRWGGGQPGESWCCYMLTMWLDLFYQGNSPVPRTGSCQDVLDLARKNGWVIDQPEVGCIVISVNEQGHAHHIALCIWPTPLSVIAGNTSADGLSSNGDRVAEHTVSPMGKVFVRLPR